jgi:hypothetical protein
LRYFRVFCGIKKDFGVFCGIVGGILVWCVLFYVNLWYFGVICGILCWFVVFWSYFGTMLGILWYW